MSPLRAVLVGSWALAAVLSGADARALDFDELPKSRTCRLCGREEPELTLTVPVWVPLVVGTFGYSRFDGSDVDLGNQLEIDSAVQFAFMGQVSVRGGGLAIAAESFGLSLANEVNFRYSGTSVAAVDLSAAILRLSAAYHLPPLAFGDGPDSVLVGLVPYGGARLHKIELDASSADASGAMRTFWYPLAGLALEFDFRIGLMIRVEADWSGFEASQSAGWGAVALDYAFARWISLSAGWNFYRLVYSQDVLDLRVRLNGPQMGLSFYL